MHRNETKNTRRRWTFGETQHFLKCYIDRKDEFKLIKKKKIAYANVLKDMIEQGFSDTSLKISALEAKMRTLLQTYKNAINSDKKFPFMNEMDEIFGAEPITSIQGSIQEGWEPDDIETSAVSNSVSPARTLSNFDIASSSSNSVSSLSSLSTFDIDAMYNSPSSILARNTKKRKRKSPKEIYYEKKLELKKKFYEDIKEMIAKKLNSL